jgi:hypothetical protein
MKGGDSMTDNQNTSQNLNDEDQSKGGKASSSQQDMSSLDQMGGNAAQHGDGHKLTEEEQSEGASR